MPAQIADVNIVEYWTIFSVHEVKCSSLGGIDTTVTTFTHDSV